MSERSTSELRPAPSVVYSSYQITTSRIYLMEMTADMMKVVIFPSVVLTEKFKQYSKSGYINMNMDKVCQMYLFT